MSENLVQARKPPQAQVFCHNMSASLLAGSLGRHGAKICFMKEDARGGGLSTQRACVASPGKWGPWFSVGHMLTKPLTGTVCGQGSWGAWELPPGPHPGQQDRGTGNACKGLREV